MNKENNTPFKVEDVNWEELAGIGILKGVLFSLFISIFLFF